MQRHTAVLTGCAIAALVGLGSFASGMGEKPAAPLKATGKVQAVDMKDAKRPTVTVKTDQGNALSFQIDPKKTVVVKDNRSTTLSHVRVGDIIRAEYEVRRRTNLAKLLLLETPPQPKPAAKSSGTTRATRR